MVPSFNSFELARRLPNAQLSIFLMQGTAASFSTMPLRSAGSRFPPAVSRADLMARHRLCRILSLALSRILANSGSTERPACIAYRRSLVAAGRNSSSLRIPRRKSLGEGEQGQLLRPGGKAAGGKPVQAGSHGKFPQLRDAAPRLMARERTVRRAVITLLCSAALYYCGATKRLLVRVLSQGELR